MQRKSRSMPIKSVNNRKELTLILSPPVLFFCKVHLLLEDPLFQKYTASEVEINK